MKIPLRELEEARHDPRAYLQRQRRAAQGEIRFNPKNKHQTLKRAIYVFHKSNDLQAAHDYLEKSYLKQFKQTKDLILYAEKLEKCAIEFNQSGATVFKVNDRLVVPLPQDLNDAGVIVSGEIPRVDLTDDGYTAWLFSKKTEQWEDELRLPVIQFAYAQILGAIEDEIKIGVYDFSQGTQKLFSFPEQQLSIAQNEFHELLKQILKLGESNLDLHL